MVYHSLDEIKNTYSIIYADPPWKFGRTGKKKWKPASHYYQTLSPKQLSALPIGSLAKEDCILFMWVVSPELDKCIEVGKAWGFEYITVGFVWYKQRSNVGNYTLPQCELCLIFKRGKIPIDRVRSPGTKQFLSEHSGKHSAKPIEIRKRIEGLFPLSNKIELFARDTADGWDSFGNEV